MAGIIQRMQGIERVNFFGVRHLSPAASWHLLKFLDKNKPKCVLIEGPSDADYLIESIVSRNVKPPIAILAYTSDMPVSTVLYPFADYSPEYQAMKWAVKNKADVRFIDLPTSISISLNRYSHNKDEENTSGEGYCKYAHDLYKELTVQNEEHSFDSYWERNFEHNLNENAYNDALSLQSSEIRRILEPVEYENLPASNAADLVREAYMTSQIQKSMEQYAPEEIAVITGAYHAKRMLNETEPMKSGEIEILPYRDSKLTLMPYSFYRLSSRSGYGAGNSAPEYYQLMWECMRDNRLNELPAEYVSKLGRFIREGGGYCSTANVIETVRLSFALTYLKGGALPTLTDLHDACISCIGYGDLSEVATAFAMADIGTAFGSLPEGVSQTPVQDDMNRELKRLKLEKYKTTVTQQLDLDLRENTKVKSEESAFIDLNRSTFLHRLEFLGIGFAKKLRTNQDGATWRESWTLVWSPEVEIQVVESVLKGETIELAAAFSLKEKLDECNDILQAARLISSAYICRLTDGVDNAVSTLQAIAVDSGNFPDTAKAALELSSLIQYKDIRHVNTEALVPLLKQLFLRSCLILSDAASCDDKAASDIAAAIGVMHNISQENFEIVDDAEWVKALWDLVLRDDKNAKLSGLAFAVLLERNLITDEFCSKEVSRRLSPGIPADIGAGWFEGMSMRNHYALLSRIELWRELDQYIQSLDDDEFKRSVVFMRRAFGSFDPREKNGVAELLGEFWGVDASDAAIFLQGELNEEEVTTLDELNDFDFDF